MTEERSPQAPPVAALCAARGAGTLIRPYQLPSPPARGAGTLLCPGQPVFFAARGADAPLRPWQQPFPPTGALELFSSLPLWQEDSTKQAFYILLTGILFWKQAVCRVLSQEDSTQTMLQGLFSGILDQLEVSRVS